jgi:uncharacterized FAD-dependent dehydrogenase
MSFILRNLSLSLGTAEETLAERLCQRYGLSRADLLSWRLLRKGIDARKKPRIKFIYTIEFTVASPERFWLQHGADPDLEQPAPIPVAPLPQLSSDRRIVVVGLGPAGLFAALRLSEYGLTPLVIERGRPISDRIRDVQRFWDQGVLDPASNVQFGEGGAGTFSDGKLTTRVRDPHSGYVLETLVRFGAPPEIAWLAKPHIGTDRLRTVVTALREFLIGRGVEVRFNQTLTDLQISQERLSGIVINDGQEEPCAALILAPGHSARDTYRLLLDRGVRLEAKPFAVGVRVEHPQELINRIQYGLPQHPQLPAADYALAYNNTTSGRSAYSFCMCPGGVVVAGASEAGGVVTNGMSSHRRNSPSANSALVVTVGRADFADASPLAGIEFQRRLERQAFTLGGGAYRAPAQNLLAFLGRQRGGPYQSSYRPGVQEADLAALFPPFVTDTLREGIIAFDRKMRGFLTGEATLTGVESRTSAPVRIVRGEDCQSVTLAGLYPAGEGAGYAGGIMSAALDGIRVADAIAQQLAAAANIR